MMGVFLDALEKCSTDELIAILGSGGIKVRGHDKGKGMFVCSCFTGNNKCFQNSRTVFYQNTGSIVCHAHGTKSLWEVLSEFHSKPMDLLKDKVELKKNVIKYEVKEIEEVKEHKALSKQILDMIKDSTKKNRDKIYYEFSCRGFSNDDADILLENNLIFYVDNSIKKQIPFAPDSYGYNLCIPSFNKDSDICAYEFYAGEKLRKSVNTKYFFGKGGKNTFFDTELNPLSDRKILYCIEGFFDSLRFITAYYNEYGCLPYAVATITAHKNVTELNTYKNCDEVFLLFDQDEYGLRGAIKNIDIIGEEKKVYFNTYSKEYGKGIDEFLQTYSIEKLFELYTGE